MRYNNIIEKMSKYLAFLWYFSLIQDSTLFYSNREDQGLLLSKVLAANDTDADEERMPFESTSKSYKKVSGKMSSMSGADDAVYAEFKRNSGAKHPLFKKFRK